MKITNTGHTVIISGKWKCERPYLTGGPLDGKYVFSQIHFHWGPDNCKGSEHQVCGESFPLEMHVAHFKTEYMTQESALREKDGMVVLVYLFKLQEEPNNSLKKIISALPSIKQANTSQSLECRSILALCNPFTDDYFMYWGSVVTPTCAHILLWIVCREPFGISREQMEEFRKILDASHHPIRRNSREPQPLHKRNVFHVNASRHMDEPMLPIKNILGCFCYPASDSNGREDQKGDGGCNCNPSYRPQEELEGRQDPGCKQEIEVSRGNGVYLQQTVYYQHATVHSVPTLQKRYDDPIEKPETDEKDSEEKPPEPQEVSQSCCFFSIEEEKSLSGDKQPRERPKERKRKPIDSVTTLANLIETLETLKTQTYKKLKEIESINHEIRGMKSSCENLEERHWLRHAEKIMSRQKRFTIRSSQCCFSELKKLAKECNFDKLLDDKLISGTDDGKPLLLSPAEATDSALVCSNPSGDKLGFTALEKIESTPFNLYNSERFSRKSQKLIRSFFEDIKESEEAQINLEKNLLLRKFERLSKRRSDQSNASSLNIPHGHMYVTKNMMNMGRIREQFFTEIPNEEKTIATTETKMVPAGKKKKKRSFFKMSLNGFDSDKSVASKKTQKRALFTKSALAWLNNRINTLHDTSPVIPLRITDIELKTGSIITRKKSKQSVKSTSVRKVVSDEHVRTEVSSYLSESIISEFSDKQSKISKQSRTQTRSIIRGIERNSETRKSEVSVMRIVKDLDANNFFVQLSNSANISSATSLDSERKDAKFIKRRSRKDIWENGSSTISGYRKEVNNKYYGKGQDVHCISSVTGNIIERRISTSSDSSITIKKQSKREMVLVTSRKPSKSEMVRSRDVSVDATEDKSADSPKRKKMKLEWKCKSYDVQPQEVHAISYIETECHKVSYVENECQADLKPASRGDEAATSQEKMTQSTDVSTRNSLEKFEILTQISLPSPTQHDIESQTETEKDSPKSPRQLTRDTSVEAFLTLPTVAEDAPRKAAGEPSKKKELSENEASEVSVSPRRSSDTLSEHSKDFSFEIKRTVVLSNRQESFWTPEDVRFGRTETSPIRDQVPEIPTDDLADLCAQFKDEEPARVEPPTKTEQEELLSIERNHPLYFSTSNHLLGEENVKSQTETPAKEPEFNNLFTVEEIEKSADVSREISQNELSECNEYDLQTDSNGTMHYNPQKERSRDTTPSIPSSDEEKQLNTSIATASSILQVNSQQKPFSAESFNSFKNAYEVKHRKRRQCIKKKSKQLIRKNTSMIRKLNKIGGNNLDFTNLTEEEQLKIISANVARFVKQKLVEHKQFFDFEKNEPITFDVEQWSKTGENELVDEPEVIQDSTPEVKLQQVEEEPKPREPKAKEAKTKETREAEETPVAVPPPQPPTPAPIPPPQRQATPPPPPPQQTTPPPPPAPQPPKERAPSVTPPLKEAKEEPEVVPEVSEAVEDQALSIAGDTEKDDKNDPGRQTLDFIKLNKLMAGKYKRRVAPEAGKRGGKKPGKKEVKEAKKEAPARSPTPKSAPTGKETEPPPKVTEQVVLAPAEPPPQLQPKAEPPPPKLEIPRPAVGRGVRAPSADSGRRGVSLQRGLKSDIPVPSRDSSGSPRPGRIPPRSASVTPTITKPTPRAAPATTPTPAPATPPPAPAPATATATTAATTTTAPTPPLALQKPKQPKKRLIPTYTLTSYLSTPTEVLEYQQRELDRYLSQSSDLTVYDKSKSKKYKGKHRDPLSKKNLDYLIMLQKRINHEISANIENSMNYVKTLLSQDYNGTAIIEKAPVKNSLDMFDSTNGGIVLIEMNDQFDCSSSSSEFSEESGFYCIYQGRNNRRERNRNLSRDLIVKRNESGDSGLVDSRVFEDLQNDTDSSYNCEVSIVVNPNSKDEDLRDEKPDKSKAGDVSDVLKKYIYHLGGGEESECFVSEPFAVDETLNTKPQLKKRKERILDIPKEMKRKLLDILEDEMKSPPPQEPHPTPDSMASSPPESVDSSHTIVLDGDASDSSVKKNDDTDSENMEIISKISEMVMQYLDEYDRKLNSDQEQAEDRKTGGELSDDGAAGPE